MNFFNVFIVLLMSFCCAQSAVAAAPAKAMMEESNAASEAWAKTLKPYLATAQQEGGNPARQTQFRAALRALNNLACVEGTRVATKQDHELFYVVALLNAVYFNSFGTIEDKSLQRNIGTLFQRQDLLMTNNAQALIGCAANLAKAPWYKETLKTHLLGRPVQYEKALIAWAEGLHYVRAAAQGAKAKTLTSIGERDFKALGAFGDSDRKGLHELEMRRTMPAAELVVVYSGYDARYSEVKHDMDVHASNRILNFKAVLPVLYKHDNISNKNSSFASVVGFLRKSCNPDVLGTLNTNLAQLEAHIKGNPVENSETGAQVVELFSRLGWFAERLPSYTESLIKILCDNSLTGGGCYPGHAGRFAELYVRVARQLWWGLDYQS